MAISLYMFLYSKSSCSSYCINKNFACYKPKAPRTAPPSHMCILFFNTPNVCITTYRLASPRHDNCGKKILLHIWAASSQPNGEPNRLFASQLGCSDGRCQRPSRTFYDRWVKWGARSRSWNRGFGGAGRVPEQALNDFNYFEVECDYEEVGNQCYEE